VTSLEADNKLQDLVLSVHHAVRHSFNDVGVTKIIENHHGRAYLESTKQIIVGPVPVGPSGFPVQLPGKPSVPIGSPQGLPKIGSAPKSPRRKH
jgi:hypothetical protein